MIGVPVLCVSCVLLWRLGLSRMSGVVVSSAVVWCGVSGEKKRLVESDYRSTTFRCGILSGLMK